MAKKQKVSSGNAVSVRPRLAIEADEYEAHTVEQRVMHLANQRIREAHEQLAKLAALPEAVRNLPVKSLHEVGHYF